MAIQQRRSKLKLSSGAYRKDRKKKIRELGNGPTQTKLGATKSKTKRVRGGFLKSTLLQVETVNLFNPKEKKYSKEKIKSIVENAANRHFVRRGILTKGAVVETEKGKARVVSRPGQTGSVNAVLIDDKKE